MHRYRWLLYSVVAVAVGGSGIWYTMTRSAEVQTQTFYTDEPAQGAPHTASHTQSPSHGSASHTAHSLTTTGASPVQQVRTSGDTATDAISLRDVSRYDIHTLQETYERAPTPELAAYITQLHLSIYAYDDARTWIEQTYTYSAADFPRDSYLHTRLNTMGYGRDGIQAYRDDLAQFHASHPVAVRAELVAWQNALMALVDGQHEQFWAGLEGLAESSAYREIIQAIYATQELVFDDSPSYYRYALIAKVLFEHGYVDIARRVVGGLLITNPDYLLARQIAGYSAFLMGAHDVAIEHLTYLLHNDAPNKQTYALMRGIISYDQKKYQQASLLFGQAVQTPLALRYQILVAREIGGVDDVVSLYRQLVKVDKLSPHDIMTFFDYVIGHDDIEQLWSVIPLDTKQAIMDVIEQCKQYDIESPLCGYGVGRYYMIRQQDTDAYRYISRAVEEYPDELLLVWLARWYRDMDSRQDGEQHSAATGSDDLIQKTKHYYTQAILHSDVNSRKAAYKRELVEFMLQNKQK